MVEVRVVDVSSVVAGLVEVVAARAIEFNSGAVSPVVESLVTTVVDSALV